MTVALIITLVLLFAVLVYLAIGSGSLLKEAKKEKKEYQEQLQKEIKEEVKKHELKEKIETGSDQSDFNATIDLLRNNKSNS